MFSMERTVNYSEVDEKGKLKVEKILNFFEDCTTAHSESIHMGLDYMKELKKGWILSSWQVIINECPEFKEKFTVTTSAYDIKGFYGYRNFRLATDRNQDAVLANSIWIYIDLETGKPCRAGQDMAQAYGIDEKIDMEYAGRKIEPAATEKTTEIIRVGKSFIDTNGHMNNVEYVRVAADCIPYDFQIKQLRVEYKKQAFMGDVIIPWMAKTEKGYLVELKSEAGDTFAVVEFQ